ncbi:unnamed protein product [Cuscuta campestris]|uniref:BTB domain-containing protein n=1 Tax=Cuscuta campestris TaxID=132261 RepID=A0A484JYE9_9ASTE|nr:unnamed protein product [Cuscuta campestris]
MAEIGVTRVVEKGQTKVKTVPIAVTPEGFWCCPSPVVFQKSSKSQHNTLSKPKSSLKKQTSIAEKKQAINVPQPRPNIVSNSPNVSTSAATEQTHQPNVHRNVSIEFGEPRTSDLRVVLKGKQGFGVKLNVHRAVLAENSSFFASKLVPEQEPVFQCIEVKDCDDAEIYVETVGLMYCKDLRPRLIKQSVSRVLRILKVAEQIGFKSCIQSCLEHLEAVPWVGEEEEEKVVAAVARLQGEGMGVNPVLKRVSPGISKQPKDTLTRILESVLNSDDERGRREMKTVVLKLLREHSSHPSLSGSDDMCNEILRTSCERCLCSLLGLFRRQEEEEDSESTRRKIAVQADNLEWMLEMLTDRQAGDGFASMWASQKELASLHAKLHVVARHHVSFITARLFVGIGRGEILPCKETRHCLLETWLEPLMSDYGWLHHGSRSFDRRAVEEGIGRTVLTLPLEDQQRVLLAWLDSFLKAGDNCPNLHRAFEVWWRRTFVRPFTDS